MNKITQTCDACGAALDAGLLISVAAVVAYSKTGSDSSDPVSMRHLVEIQSRVVDLHFCNADCVRSYITAALLETKPIPYVVQVKIGLEESRRDDGSYSQRPIGGASLFPKPTAQQLQQLHDSLQRQAPSLSDLQKARGTKQ